MKTLAIAALAALSIGSIGTAASAATLFNGTYDLGTVDSDASSATTFYTITNHTGATQTYADFFNFTLSSAGTSDTLLDEFKISGASSVTLTLFSGTADHFGNTPGAVQIGSTTSPSLNPEIVTDLAAGNYFVEALAVLPNKGSDTFIAGTTFLSAAPEPQSWVLMIAGIGLVGGMMRYGRRSAAAVAA
jgi:hypothetical protein